MKHAQNLESKAGDKGKFYYKKAPCRLWLVIFGAQLFFRYFPFVSSFLMNFTDSRHAFDRIKKTKHSQAHRET